MVALRPKMYCYKIMGEEDKPEKKAKGVPKQTVKRDLDMNDYENVLNENITKQKTSNIQYLSNKGRSNIL